MKKFCHKLYPTAKPLALALVAALSASAWADGVPFSIFRLGGSTSPDRWPRVCEMIRRNRAVIDEVWFSTGCDIPTVAEHRRRAACDAKPMADLRQMGIVASLQVQATVGHGLNTRDGKPSAHRTWKGLTGADGYESWDCNCPRDPAYRAYWREAIRPYAALKPGSVWIDDDLRLDRHGAVNHGCFCDICVQAFAEKEHKDWTRETLVAALGKDASLAERWRAHGFEALAGLAAEIACEVRRLSPETRLGLQYPWADKGQLQILDALAKVAGGKVGVRPGCGAYSDRNPFDQLDKVNRLSRQMKTLLERPDLYDQICPEIETYPRTFGMRTAKSLAFEALCQLAQGCDSLSWYFTGGGDDETWYDRVLFRALRENMALYKAFVRFNRHTIACGFTAPDIGDDPEAPHWPTAFSTTAVPFTFGKGDILGHAMPGWFTDRLSDGQLAEILSGPVLIDHDGLRRLQKRKLLPASIRGAGRYATPQKGRAGISPSLSPETAGAAENLRYRERARYATRFLPAEVIDPCVAAVWCRLRDDGSRAFASMTMLNARIDEQESVRVVIQNFPTARAVWWELGKKPVELDVKRTNGFRNSVEVTLPPLGAWSAGFLVPGRVEKGDVVEDRGVGVAGRIETEFGHLYPGEHHVQGVDVTPEAIYFSQSGALQKTDWHGRCLAKVKAKCHHNGDVCAKDGKVYVVHTRKNNDQYQARIVVYDADLREIGASEPVSMALDGLTYYDGHFVSSRHPPETSRRTPQDTAYLVRFDPQTLKVVDETVVPLGFETKYFLPQNLTTDGELLYLGCYGKDDRKVADVLVVDRAFKPVRLLRTECGEGFVVLPERLENAVVGPSGKRRALVGRTLWTQDAPRQYILNLIALDETTLR